MTTRYERIHQVLETVFKPSLLEIADESAKHASHVKRTGVAAGGETHYDVVLVSEVFAGKSRLARSRSVHEALEAEFKTGLHALSLTLRAPAEAE